jgi:hypothetical protein
VAKDQTRRLTPAQISEDEKVYAGVKALTNYTPANPAYALSALDAARAAMHSAQQQELAAQAAAESARDALVAAQWNYHNALLGAGEQVSAQYGKDSNEWQSLGKKKKSEFKARAPKKAEN